jgi:uncharacterized protein YuzE
MALTQETLNYLKIPSLLQYLPKRLFSLLYDFEADVMYIDFYNPPQNAEDSELTDDNIIIRYNATDEIVGLTILHASKQR